MDDGKLGTGARDPVPVARLALLAALLAALAVFAAGSAGNEEGVMDAMVFALFAAAPLLVWFTIEPEPEPAPERVIGTGRRVPLWLRFPFLPGGASGVAYFLLTFAAVIAAYVLWVRFGSRRGVWFADDDPVQLVLGALYACVYVLLPVGLCSPILRHPGGRIAAVVLCALSYPTMRAVFAQGPREPDGLTELGDPGYMICTVLADGRFVHYARNDLAVLVGLAALGVALNVPRVVRRWGELSRGRGAAKH